MRAATAELIGRTFGRLTVETDIGPRRLATGRSKRFLSARCQCGTAVEVTADNLRSGHTQSCGCFHHDNTLSVNVTHGDTRVERTTEYRSWDAMKQRCLNPNDQKYPRYGGRGITICDRWLNSFESFLADMGRKPSPIHTIDRYPENDGNYEPGNCRWATPHQQADNRQYGSERTS